MQSATALLEKRVTMLEHELRKVKSSLKAARQAPPTPWWEQLAGQFKDDPLFEETIKAGQMYRRSQSPRTRK
jgi:hypothetical protein